MLSHLGVTTALNLCALHPSFRSMASCTKPPGLTLTPQQNGRVERKHRHIRNVARACLFQNHLPVKFWGESILTATHLINQMASPVLKGKTPYELLFCTRPKYDMIRTFGCSCYAHLWSRDKDKFGTRSRRCVFVGYPYGKKGW